MFCHFHGAQEARTHGTGDGSWSAELVKDKQRWVMAGDKNGEVNVFLSIWLSQQLLPGYQVKIAFIRCVNNCWKVTPFDAIFYLTSLSHVVRMNWLPYALHVRNQHCIFPSHSWESELLRSAGSFHWEAQRWLSCLRTTAGGQPGHTEATSVDRLQQAVRKCDVWIAWVSRKVAGKETAVENDISSDYQA